MRLSQFASLPRPPRSLLPDRFTALLIGAALLGAALTLARQITYGTSLGFDGVQYIAAARSLLDGNGFTLWTGSPFILFPPFYSAALAGASFGALDPRDVAGPLNSAVFGLIIFISGQWMRRRGVAKPLVAWACLSVAFAAPVTRFVSDVLSEPFFILFTIAALIQTDNYMRTNKTSSLAWISAFTALAWLTRYIGVALFVVIAALLVCQPGIRLIDKAKRIAFYSLIALTPITLWVLRNLLTTGSPAGASGSADYAIPDMLYGLLKVVGAWALPTTQEAVHRFAAPLLGGGILAAFGLGASAVLLRKRSSGDWSEWLLFALLGLFGIAFVFITFALVWLNTPHGIQDRHFIPAYIPFLLASLIPMQKFFRRAQTTSLMGKLSGVAALGKLIKGRARDVSVASALLILALASWSACNVLLTIDHIRDNNLGISIGYSAPRWAKSELLRHIEESDIPGPIISNDAYIIYAYTKKPAYYIADEDGISQQFASYGDGTSVAFFDTDYPGPYSMSYFRGRAGVETVAEFSDGILLRVNGQSESGFPARYEALTRSDPVARSAWDIHLDGRTLTYAKSPCSQEDRSVRFFLHVVPVDRNDLQDERKAVGFDNLDFRFESYGVRFDGACLAGVSLPAYPIKTIITGQFSGAGRHWEANFAVP